MSRFQVSWKSLRLLGCIEKKQQQKFMQTSTQDNLYDKFSLWIIYTPFFEFSKKKACELVCWKSAYYVYSVVVVTELLNFITFRKSHMLLQFSLQIYHVSNIDYLTSSAIVPTDITNINPIVPGLCIPQPR